MTKRRITLIIVLTVLILLIAASGIFIVNVYRWDNVGKQLFKGIITEENVERITVCENVFDKDAKEVELKPDSQAFMLACAFADELKVYLPPRLIFGRDSHEISYGGTDHWEITYYLKDGDIHRIRADISENTAPIQTEYFVFIEGERYYINKDRRAYYYLEIDGKRYDVKGAGFVNEFAGVVEKGLK